MELKQAIALWKEKNISRCSMEYYCGGDNMGDYSFVFYDEEDNEIECKELVTFFDDEVFKHVDFYVNSDGHYMGESGSVEIELDENDDYESFDYTKCAEYEYSETIESTITLKLTEEEVNYFNEYVRNIIGGEGENPSANYSKDFIMTDELVNIEKGLMDKIDDLTTEFMPDTDEEVQDWFSFEINDLIGDELQININNSITIFRGE